jgi:hypothetical protein
MKPANVSSIEFFGGARQTHPEGFVVMPEICRHAMA